MDKRKSFCDLLPWVMLHAWTITIDPNEKKPLYYFLIENRMIK